MCEAIFFYTFTGIMLLGALSVISNRQPIYSVLSLLLVMFCLAALFIMLGAYFIAALQVLLYAGAVLVLFLFVIMLLNLAPEELARSRVFTLRVLGACTAFLFFILFVKILAAPTEGMMLTPHTAPNGSIESIGKLLFEEYLLPFELTSFIILAAVIGAVTLGKQHSKE